MVGLRTGAEYEGKKAAVESAEAFGRVDPAQGVPCAAVQWTLWPQQLRHEPHPMAVRECTPAATLVISKAMRGQQEHAQRAH
jgi:hypothetical protein